MTDRGLRGVLEPAFYLGVAALLHGVLLLSPAGILKKAPPAETARGVRVKAVKERLVPPSAPPRPLQAAPIDPAPPPVSADRNYSMVGGGTPGPAAAATPGGPAAGSVQGEGGTSDRTAAARPGAPPETEFGAYLARLRSESVQGWAKKSASQARQSWKGSGKGATGAGWGEGGGAGGIGQGQQGGGTGTQAGGGGAGAGFMDPRVRMVVTSYPLDRNGSVMSDKGQNIEDRLTPVPYPDRKFKKHEYTSGWWNVYLQVRTDGSGAIRNVKVLRPETDGSIERIFIAQVRGELDRWSFDAREMEIHVDVRFYVE